MINETVANKRLVLAWTLLVLAVLLAACGSAAAEPAVPPTNTAAPTEAPPTATAPPPTDTPEPPHVADPQRGREIFLNGGANESYNSDTACGHCHSLDGSVSAKYPAAPSLLGVAARAGERVPGLSAEEYIRQSILDPKVFVVPSYKNTMSRTGGLLEEAELDDVIAFLLTLTDKTVDPADIKPMPVLEVDLGMSVEEGNPVRGRVTGSVYRCLACHADEEVVGYAPPFASTEDLPPIMERGELRIADPAYEGQAASNQEYVLESIFMPGVYLVPGEWKDTMPYNFHDYITDEELADIMAWMKTFSEAD
jgi:mono/diheme cytochrome c family protein